MPVPRRALTARLAAWKPVLRESEIAAWTGLSSERWRQLAARFPDLPRTPGPRAARARRRMGELAGRALSGGEWDPLWEGSEPPRASAVYVTAHLGSLLALRYVLRARGVAVASVIAPYNFERADPAAKDAVFDRRFPIVFPHVVSSAHTHRLRGLLKRGSLILAADLPSKPAKPSAASEAAAFPARLLGGTVDLDPRPFRLARLAGVPCLPVFLTLPRRRWTLTLGRPLPANERDELHARDAFARAFESAAERAPWDLDGPVYWNRYVASRMPA
ncbi:MAG TPA: hypothetical protein VGO79_13520 [Thermoanaerobaculia bacterium]|jgi:hypothetical protein